MPKRAQGVEEQKTDVSQCDLSATAPKLNDSTKAQRAQNVHQEFEPDNGISEDEFEEESVYDNAEASDAETTSSAGDLCRPWTAGADALREGEELEHDERAYDMFHRAMFDSSCYSFDILPDALGLNRSDYPHTAYVVAGTQVPVDGSDTKNRVYVSKWRNLSKTCPQNDDDSDSDSGALDDEGENAPVMDFRFFNHPGGVNRLRVCPQLPRLVGTWCEDSVVYLWDIHEYKTALESPGVIPKPTLAPKYRFSGHTDEGFALDFNPLATGVLATGSRDHSIRIWKPVEGGWEIESPIKAHKDSVEGVAWCRVGSNTNVLASCSVDRSICIFDLTASKRSPQICIPQAHELDVNAIAWSPFQEELLLSGGDDGVTRVWDTRNTSEPIVHLKWHRQPISSLGWHPTDSSTFAVASMDNSITLWDMSVELSDDAAVAGQSDIPPDYPDQLMFQHMGQTHISDIHWHPQIPGVLISTAEDGVNIFKTFNM